MQLTAKTAQLDCKIVGQVMSPWVISVTESFKNKTFRDSKSKRKGRSGKLVMLARGHF